jgi:hypothetical protein
MKPYLEKSASQKRAGGVAQGVGPKFKPQYCKKKKWYHLFDLVSEVALSPLAGVEEVWKKSQ